MNATKLLKSLAEWLTEEEMRRIAAGALGLLKPPQLEHLCRRLGKDTAETVRNLLAGTSRKRPAAAPAPGRSKLRAEWDAAWADWEDVLEETSREDGKYVEQEHHWEPPYLDTGAVADDLDAVAARLRKLLPRVFDEQVDPERDFMGALRQATEELGSGLPDHMDPAEGDGLSFGPEATRCLLEWERRRALKRKAPPFTLAETICQAEQLPDPGISLDDDALVEFFLGLPEPDRRAILEGIQKNKTAAHWLTALESPRSAWFRIYQDLSARWDPHAHVEACRARMSKDWRLALPVLKDLLDRKRFDDAREVAREGACALLSLRPGQVFDPRRTLLAAHFCGWSVRGEEPGTPKLLRLWRRACDAAGDEESSCALSVQEELLKGWDDWDAARRAFEGIPEKLARMREALRAEWMELVVRESFKHRFDAFDARERPPARTWGHALAEMASQRPAADAAGFRGWLQNWLEEAGRSRDSLKKALPYLAVLTVDLDAGAKGGKFPPTLARILSRWTPENKALNASRRSGLEAVGGDALRAEVLRFWKENAAKAVPDPSEAMGSNYDESVQWLRAVRELDPRACETILNDWRIAHRRRLNLWKALQGCGVAGRNGPSLPETSLKS